MSKSSIEVIIIGAGLGGICLAQYLKRSGIVSTVNERHHGRAYLAEGFWIEINDEGTSSLRSCLNPKHFDLLMRITRPTNRSDCRWLPRAALQKCLLQGLEGTVRFDKTFVRYEKGSDGRVTVFFSDGSRSVADVLVAADGVHSRVRQQMLPHARRIDTGVLAIGGGAQLSAELRNVLPASVFQYPIAVNGPRHQQMFIAAWQGWHQKTITTIHDNDAADTLEDKVFDQKISDQVMWRFAGPSSDYGLSQAPESIPGLKLKETVLGMMASWSPQLRRLVELIDPATIFPLPIRSCVPIERWTTGPVTLVGDAIHGMAPYGGFGANTAIRDAAVLGENLVSVNCGNRTLLEAISRYEAEMTKYGFDAVRRSMQILQQANGMHPIPL
jgi:2-polyprenyl-6-methoxyphenol hydroxylase-like FAD-dependent oxidoreductase